MNDGPAWGCGDDWDSAPNLRELVSHRYVLEVLDALGDGPMTLADLHRRARVGKRGIVIALRILGARGLVSKSHPGTWDSPAPADTLYRPTDQGRATIDVLSRFSVWTSIVEGSDPDDPPRPPRGTPRSGYR